MLVIFINVTSSISATRSSSAYLAGTLSLSTPGTASFNDWVIDGTTHGGHSAAAGGDGAAGVVAGGA